jgi:hypothetical protein
MKKILSLLLISVFALTSCGNDGPIGPQGPQGPQGPAGADGLIGTVIDLQGSFTSVNDFLVLDFNEEGIEVFESDVVLVYLKTGEDGTAGGLPVEVFSMLPHTEFDLPNGQILQYDFDFTFFDVQIFLKGTFDFDALDSSYTTNKIFRIVVVPAEFAQTSGIDMSNMNAVMHALDIQAEDIKKGEIQ